MTEELYKSYIEGIKEGSLYIIELRTVAKLRSRSFDEGLLTVHINDKG